ncbi:hypothetical protein BG004_003472 [Podila humilis]|nr:hypothetical protein BG004_003472 [Podila humilis]
MSTRRSLRIRVKSEMEETARAEQEANLLQQQKQQQDHPSPLKTGKSKKKKQTATPDTGIKDPVDDNLKTEKDDNTSVPAPSGSKTKTVKTTKNTAGKGKAKKSESEQATTSKDMKSTKNSRKSKVTKKKATVTSTVDTQPLARPQSAEADAATPVKTKGKRSKRKKEEVDGPTDDTSENPIKKQCTEQENDENSDTNNNDITDDPPDDPSSTDPSTSSAPTPVKKKKAQKKKKILDANGDEIIQSEIPIDTALIPKNRTDPCSVLPTEVWHKVLDNLPLSVITQYAVVNNTWLIGLRSYNGWRIAAEKGNMGVPKRKFKSFMALVCAHSFFVCDNCLSYSTGKDGRSSIPLPVQLGSPSEDNQIRWNLCLDCRLEHYRHHKEGYRSPCDPNNEATYVEHESITKSVATNRYYLDSSEVMVVPHELRANPHYAGAAPMQIYLEKNVQKHARLVHGGWVGVDAAVKNIVAKRKIAFRERMTGRPVPPKGPRKPRVYVRRSRYRSFRYDDSMEFYDDYRWWY